MSSSLNESSALERIERGYAIEIRNRIMFNFYPGLPHMIVAHSYCNKLLAWMTLSHVVMSGDTK